MERPAKNIELELKSQDFESKTFSAHDLAAIKIIYGKKRKHHGQWHEACGSKCTETGC